MIQLTGNNILFIIIFFNLLFVAVITFFVKNGKPYANKLFSLFLLAKVLCFSTDFFYCNFEYSITRFIHVFQVGLSFDLLLGPLMLFYIRSLTRTKFKFEKKHIIHLIPFVLHLGYMAIVFHLKSAVLKKELIETGALFTLSYRIINEVLIYCSFVIYGGFIIKEILGYHKAIKNIYADFNKFRMNWMIFLTIGLCSIWLLAITSGAFSFIGYYSNIPLLVYILPIFLFANIIFFYGMRYSQSFAGIDYTQTVLKYKKTIIPDEKKDELLEKLLKYIETEKPYLEPDININKLAEELAVPSYQISQILNSKLKKNFFEFISYYRIKESMEHLSKPHNHDKTILEILYEVGFNSKSAFNNAFKKHTGVTPTEFKKQSIHIEIPSLNN